MFSPDFDKLYNEAFATATGMAFESDEVQKKYREYSAKTTEALLDHWTSPESDTQEYADHMSSRGANVFRLRHPHTEEFGLEEAEDIAKIRFFGRQTIDVAAKYAPPIDMEKSGRGLRIMDWYEANSDRHHTNNNGERLPDAPSPLHLEKWPHGRLINCLGAAIGAAGQCEREEKASYYFMNRIRHGQYEINPRVMRMIEYLRTSYPAVGLYEEITAQVEDDPMLLIEDTPKFLTDIGIDDQFHHGIIAKNIDSPVRIGFGPDLIQVDPWALVHDTLGPLSAAVHLDGLLETMDDGTCNEVLFFDSDMIDLRFQKVENQIKTLEKMRYRLDEVLDDYKHPNYISHVKSRVQEQFDINIATLLSNDPSRSKEEILTMTKTNYAVRNNLSKGDMERYWLMMLAVTLHETHLPASEEVRGLFDEDLALKPRSEIDHELLESEIMKMEQYLQANLKYDRKLQQLFHHVVGYIPALLMLEHLRSFARSTSLSFGGTHDQAMEVGDAAFMTGAMYINNYAKNEKCVNINAAKEVARLTPSQLIWQAAVAGDPDAANIGCVYAVGRLTKSLKHDQQHPLVRITPQPKE